MKKENKNIIDDQIESHPSARSTKLPEYLASSTNSDTSSEIIYNDSIKFVMPLQLTWKPKEDITVYELAQCLPYIINTQPIMPYMIDIKEPYFRHFEIINHNE